MTDVNLNMVHAGVVDHPSEWPRNGFVEIQSPRKRYVVIDQDRLTPLAGDPDLSSFARQQPQRVEFKIAQSELARNPR